MSVAPTYGARARGSIATWQQNTRCATLSRQTARADAGLTWGVGVYVHSSTPNGRLRKGWRESVRRGRGAVGDGAYDVVWGAVVCPVLVGPERVGEGAASVHGSQPNRS